MYRSVDVLAGLSTRSFGGVFATWVAAKAKVRKSAVPTNSPSIEMNKWRTLFGNQEKPGSRFSPGRFGSSVYVGFIPGKTMKLSAGVLTLFMLGG